MQHVGREKASRYLQKVNEEQELLGDIKIIIHRIEALSKDQESSFSEIKQRISAIEGDLKSNAVWMGKTEQRLDHIENSLENQRVEQKEVRKDQGSQTEGMSNLVKLALTALGTALGVIATLVSQIKI